MQDKYGAKVTAPDEEDAQAAEYEEDDQKIKDVEDARDGADSNYHDSQESQSSGQDSQDSQSSGQESQESHSSGQGSQSSGQESQESQSSSQDSQVSQSTQDSEESQSSYHESEESQSSFASFSSDISYPPFKPKTPRKVMNLEDEDEEEAQSKLVDTAESETTPGKKQNREETATPKASPPASASRGRTGSNAGEERLPLFLPSSPSSEPPSPVASYRKPKEEPEESEEPLLLPSSQESTAGNGGQEKVETGEADAPVARSQPIAERTPDRAAVLQTLDANRTIDNAITQDTTGKDQDKNASPDAKCDDGYATPLARTPTQSTFGWQGHGRGGDRTPTKRSPDSKVQGKGANKGKGNAKGNASSEGKASAASPGAKSRGNKRPAEDSPSPRRSSKAENQVPGVEERKHKMMRKV